MRTEIINNETVIFTDKRIDAASAPKFDAEVKKVLAEGVETLVIDLAETTYISSLGLRVFLFAQKKLMVSGGELRVEHSSPAIREIFEVTGFSGIIQLV